MYPFVPAQNKLPRIDFAGSGYQTLTVGTFKVLGGQVATTYLVDGSRGTITFGNTNLYVFWANAENSVGASDGGVYYGQYSGTSPIDSLIQVQSQGYLIVTWNKLGYWNDHLERINSYQAVVATDNVNTYVCYIYPDDQATGNRNGGIDWTTEGNFGSSPQVGGVAFGIPTPNDMYRYAIPDYGTPGIAGIDGVAGDKSAATFPGTHAPGQFCFHISGPAMVPLGALENAVITAPISSATVSVSVLFAAQGLLNARQYTILVNGAVAGSFTASATGTLSTTLDLSSTPNGPVTISLRRNFDGTIRTSVTVTKALTVSITSPVSGSYINSATVVTDFNVQGTGEPGASVTITFTDSLGAAIGDVATVQPDGSWEAFPNIAGLAEGSITLVADIANQNGDEATSPVVQLIQDTITTGSITAPASGGYLQSTVTVSGTAEIGAVVSLTISDADASTRDINILSISVDGAGAWTAANINIASQTDGAVTITATFTDAARNTASRTVEVSKDTVPPTGSITSPSSGALVQGTVTVSGSAEAGASVTVSIAGSDTLTSANAAGAWSVANINLGGIVDGAVTITATFTDAAGNAASSTVGVTKDTVTAVSITTPSTWPYINYFTVTDFYTQGTGESNGRVVATFTDSLGNTAATTATVSNAQIWEAFTNVGLHDGPVTLVAVITDLAGNVATSPVVQLILDTITTGSISSPSSGGYLQSTVTVSGSAEAEASVSLSITDTDPSTRDIIVSSISADRAGAWTAANINIASQTDGAVTITATFTDTAGNTASSTVGVTKDTIPPTGSITSPSSSALVQGAVTVSGTVEPGASVSLTISDLDASTRDISITSISVDRAGSWTATNINIASQRDGAVTITATFTDAAGNTASSTVGVSKDTVPPTGSIASPSSGAIVQSTVTVRGSVEVGASVSLSISDADASTRDISISSISVDRTGAWTATNINIASQTDGVVTFTATFTDAAGNTARSTVEVSKDTVAAVSITNPSSGSYINYLTASWMQVSGTGDAFGTVTVTATDSHGATLSASATANADQNWSLMANFASLAEGAVILVASITDPAGNQAVSQAVSINKDTTTFVTITSPVELSYINQNNVYSLQFSGSGEAGGKVNVTVQDSTSSTANVQTTEVQVTPEGTWTVVADLSSQIDGSIRVTATIRDTAGNTFTCNPLSLTKDTVITVAIASPTNLQFVVTAARASSVSFAGFGDPGTRVFVTISDSDVNTANIVSPSVVVSPLGTWAVVVNVSTLVDGFLTVIVAATDAAGNLGTSNTVTLNKDTIAVGSITTPSTGTAISAAQATSLSISGTGEAGGKVALRIVGSSGVISKTVTIGAAGTWATTVNISTLPNGTITISGTVTDAGGNSSALSAVTITK